MVDGGGTIRRANPAAIGLFGSQLESGSTMFTALWAEEAESVEQFLARWERSAAAVVPLKLHGKGAVVTTFSASIVALYWDGEKRFIFQLFPEAPPAPAENRGPIVE